MRIEPMKDMSEQAQQATYDECRGRALDCLRLAHAAQDESTRADLLSTAQAWLHLAIKPYVTQFRGVGARCTANIA